MRGRVQGVERRPRGRAGLHRALLRQHRRAGRRHLAPRGLRGAGSRRRDALADVLGRVQALHVGGVPGGVPDRRALSHRVRHRRRAAGHLQRLRLLRARLPLRRDRQARGGRARPQVHPLLRPSQGRHDPGLRAGVPDRVDPVRAGGRAARARVRAPGGAAGRRRDERPAVRRGPRRRCRRPGLDLPAPGRARGLRSAARSRVDHARPGLDVARRGGRGRGAAGRDRGGQPRRPASRSAPPGR